VKGYSMPVVVGLDNHRPRIARVLGTDDFGLIPRYLEAIQNPLPPKVVQDGQAKEVKITDDIDLLKTLPAIAHYEKDGGPYNTAVVVIAENKRKNIRNISYHRLQVTGKDEAPHPAPAPLETLCRKGKGGKALRSRFGHWAGCQHPSGGCDLGLSVPFRV
jgi:UbiD family decarboxylase